MILVVYRKDNKEVVHYCDYNSNVQPTLFGLYHAGIKKNYPNLKINDLDEIKIDDKYRQDIYKHSKIKVNNNKLEFIKKAISDVPIVKEDRVKKLEDIINNQQNTINDLLKEVNNIKKSRS